MTDDTPKAVPDVAPEPATTIVHEPTPPAAQPAAKNNTLLTAVVVLAVVVVVGDYFLWSNGNGATDQVAQLQSQVATLQSRLQTVEARPLPAPPPPPPDLRPLEQRMTALEQKPAPKADLTAAGQEQIAALSSRVDGIAARQNQLGVTEQGDSAKLAAQMTDLNGKLTSQMADMNGKLSSQMADLTTQMAAVIKAGNSLAALGDRQARTARLQMANVALQSGKPLGEIPNAPPALAQFATKAPPTEAALRLSFDAAAEKAHTAGQPAKETTPFLTRVWDRAQSGITIRQGDHILVGDAVAGVLGHAKVLLEAGDLPGAVSTLDGLTGSAAAAMAPWRAQAQSLLDARAALITAANG
jgi:hypothetical protein